MVCMQSIIGDKAGWTQQIRVETGVIKVNLVNVFREINQFGFALQLECVFSFEDNIIDSYSCNIAEWAKY